MNLTHSALKHPYAVIALVLLVISMGVFGYLRTAIDLFPETAPPQVLVVTIQPGASANDVKDKITEVVEKELNTISGLKQIRSTSRDQVSSVMAEFYYTKGLGEAVLDVQNTIGRIRADLPENIREPRIYRLTEETSRPLLTLALSPKEGSRRNLSEIRLLAENQIKDRILRLEGIADVDVFGGHKPEIQVKVDRDKMAANGISIQELITVLDEQNISIPAGTIYAGDSEYLVRTAGEFKELEQIRELPVRRIEKGLLRISDLATVKLGEEERRSIYHGNGREAIALGIIRPDGANTVASIKRVKEFLPQLQAMYPNIRFEITQDQMPLIKLNLHGMELSIVQAIILTVFVIFIFLVDFRAALVVSVSIPLAFLFSLAIIWLTPFTLNMITLTGLIVAIGMVVDSSVVALENIYRHYEEMEEPDAQQAAREGTNEIALAITAGMLTTVAVLIPIIFIGGYPQRTIGRLSFTIATTLAASLVAALTVVPLLASWLLSKTREQKNIIEQAATFLDKGVDFLRRFYLYILQKALRWRVLTLIAGGAFLVITVRIVLPLIGGELMPPMDTGIVIVDFTTPATDSPDKVEKVLNRVEEVVYQQKGVMMVSSVAGSEPGAISFGTGGATAQSVKITVHLVDRTQRAETIWEIEDKWRQELRNIPGIQDYRISEFGATPMATTKAPLNIVISGPDPDILSRLADKVIGELKGVSGLVDVRRSWYFDEKEQNVTVNPSLARIYGTSPKKVAQELKAAVKGIVTTPMRLQEYLDIPIRMQYQQSDIHRLAQIEEIYIPSLFGPVPLRALAEFKIDQEQPFITREELRTTIDITGVNHTYTIKQVAEMVKQRIANLKLPQNYDIEVSGTMADMMETQKRLMRSLLIGVALLYVLLLAMFNSFLHPFSIMAAIPLAIAGALWGLLLFDKPMSMPGNMGMIFLAGTIINNSVLLLDFIINSREEGLGKSEAIMNSVSLRLRPILMTTFSTCVGLSPLVFEMAVGLERMSPLAIVASTGLLIGTFLTMVVVPVVYSCLDSLKGYFSTKVHYS